MSPSVEELLAQGVYYIRLPDDAYVSARVIKQYVLALAAMVDAEKVRQRPAESLVAYRNLSRG